MKELKTILLDFDNTIYDDLNAMRRTFVVLKKEYRFFKSVPLDELLSRFYFTDYRMHDLLKSGELTASEVNLMRTGMFLEKIGLPLKDEMVKEIHDRIREVHVRMGKPFPGTCSLLAKLKKRYRIVVVTNHMGDYQRDKISMSNLGKYIHFLIPAYDHRVFKPDIEIFKIALESVECYPDETVMIGDNWNADIKGAINAGIVPIWVNFRNEPPPEPDFPNIIRTFYPPSETIGKIEEFFSNGLSNIPIPDPLL